MNAVKELTERIPIYLSCFCCGLSTEVKINKMPE